VHTFATTLLICKLWCHFISILSVIDPSLQHGSININGTYLTLDLLHMNQLDRVRVQCQWGRMRLLWNFNLNQLILFHTYASASRHCNLMFVHRCVGVEFHRDHVTAALKTRLLYLEPSRCYEDVTASWVVLWLNPLMHRVAKMVT